MDSGCSAAAFCIICLCQLAVLRSADTVVLWWFYTAITTGGGGRHQLHRPDHFHRLSVMAFSSSLHRIYLLVNGEGLRCAHVAPARPQQGTRNKVICYNSTPAQNLTCDVWRVKVSTNERALRRWCCCTCSKWHQGFGCNKKSFDLWAQGKCLSRKNKPIRDKLIQHVFNEERHKTRFRGIKKIGNFCKTIKILDKNKTIDSTHNLKPKKA